MYKHNFKECLKLVLLLLFNTKDDKFCAVVMGLSFTIAQYYYYCY